MDTLRFFIVTWNVATKSPDQDLNSLLDFPSQYNKNKPLPDFYVIGLQEVKSQPQNLLMDSLFSDPWTSAIKKILCRQNYIIAKSIRLQGILLLVFAQMKHIVHLRDIEAQYTKTGLGGMWGNKGAVSVRFNIYGCSVALVNCHLTAHDHLLADRINDYNTIIKQHTYHVSETSNILFHDYVFWIGDLNFRMDHPPGDCLNSEQIVEALLKIEKDKYTNLLKQDQLKAVMETGEAFSEFQEPEIQFAPTYKFTIGGDEYDIKRKPSWTDRILYKVNANNYENVTLRADLTTYNSNPYYTLSDHKPVYAQYNIKISNSFASRLETRAPKRSVRMRSAKINPGVAIHSATIDSLDVLNAIPGVSSVQTDSGMSSLLEEPQAFSNYTIKTVEFSPMSRVWYIGDADYRTEITLSPDVEVNPNDWVGIFDANLESLDDYIVYEYISKVSLPQVESATKQQRTLVLSFPVGSGVRTPGFYRFIYFSQPNNDVRSVLGISDPFEVSSKEELLVSLDPCVQPSSSTSPGPSKPTTSSYVFTDFSALDVANLSKHFSNDLSID